MSSVACFGRPHRRCAPRRDARPRGAVVVHTDLRWERSMFARGDASGPSDSNASILRPRGHERRWRAHVRMPPSALVVRLLVTPGHERRGMGGDVARRESCRGAGTSHAERAIRASTACASEGRPGRGHERPSGERAVECFVVASWLFDASTGSAGARALRTDLRRDKSIDRSTTSRPKTCSAWSRL